MKKGKKFTLFLSKRYSLILLMIFIFGIISVSIFYWQMYSKIASSEKTDDTVTLEEAKLKSILESINKAEQRYKQSLGKSYRDVFK